MFRAILNTSEHGETVSIGFPISKAEYADVIAKLQQCGMGDAVRQDCRVEEVASKAFPVLNWILIQEKPNRKPAERLRFGEDEQRNGRDLPLVAGRGIWSLRGRGEAAQFQAMAHKLELHKIADFINLTFCCQEVTAITDFSDLNKVGREHYMNQHGGCAPVAEWESLNGAEIARSLIASSSGTVTPYGVVYDNGMKLEQCYQRKQFPAYSYEPELLALTLHPKGTDFNAETATWLFLPMAQAQLERAILRAGITPEDRNFQFQESRFPEEIGAAMQFDTESVFELNRLCLACEKFLEQDHIKFAAACQMARPSDAAEMRRLAENLEQFDFVPDVYSPEAYGKYMIQKSGRFEYDPNLDDFYNYSDYGAARLREETGVFTDRGYVSYRGAMALDELMRPDPAEEYRQEQGFEMKMM